MKKNCKVSQPKPAVIWLTGLSCAGKTTIAGCLNELFRKSEINPVLLDGDEIRKKLNVRNYDEESRKKHNLYVGFLASILEKEGKVVIVSLISPYSEIRDEVRNMCISFIEVYVSTRLEVCIQRDVKGQYAKAIKGEIRDFTGISAPYFPPENPEVIVDNGTASFRECSEAIFRFYIQRYAGVS